MIMMTIKYLADAGPLKAATYAMSFVLLPLFFISVIDTKSKFIKVIDTLIAAGLFLGILGLIESVMKFNFIQLLASDGTEFFHEVRYGLLRIMTTFGQPIPRYGYVAAAYTTLASYIISFTLHSRYARKLEPNLYPLKQFINPLVNLLVIFHNLCALWNVGNQTAIAVAHRLKQAQGHSFQIGR